MYCARAGQGTHGPGHRDTIGAVSLAIRAARTADLPAIYDLLELAFPEASRALFVKQTEADSTFRLRHGRVAVIDDRVCGYVRIFARRMLVRGVPVPAGGIGSVATQPDVRGEGVASMLLRDAIEQMRREGMAVSFLFTGIAPLYERQGYRVVREPQVTANAAEAAAAASASLYDVRPAGDADVPRLLALYRAATAGTTGAVVRTRRTWRDAAQSLGEADGDAFVAARHGRTVAYIRTRCRSYGHQVLELEHLRGHEGAVMPLVAAAGRIARAHGEPLVALVPDGHQLAIALLAIPSTTVTTDVRFPMMMRVLSLEALCGALLPWLSTRAAGHPGPAFRLKLNAPGESAVLDVRARSVARRGNGAAADAELDAAATLDALLGQRLPGARCRPRADAGLRKRLDALFPETPLHFWNSDRI